MPSRAYTSLLPSAVLSANPKAYRVNALSGLYLIVTHGEKGRSFMEKRCVNALSGLYLIVTTITKKSIFVQIVQCQCPLGLIPHCYSFISFWEIAIQISCVNALSGLYLIVTVPLQKPRFYAISRAYFCRYLSEYSDNNSFSCMLTIWTYFMR